MFPGGLKDKTVSGESAEYTGQITFCPSSIRLYAPPVALDKIKPYTDKDLSYAEAYTILDWDIYSRILEEVVRIGTFIS
ncbi:MAG TPA: hypothetical protein VGZ47_23345 [Gemmataceae bacterium]|nr:hypothetical protein [Gemmataceae bacterium]